MTGTKKIKFREKRYSPPSFASMPTLMRQILLIVIVHTQTMLLISFSLL